MGILKDRYLELYVTYVILNLYAVNIIKVSSSSFSTFAASLEVRGLCRRARPKLVCCDLSDDAALWGLMERFRPQAVLHLAAQWRPERLRGAPAEARRLNVDAAGSVAAACEKFKAWLVHLSADAVFDGTQPPYQADARPNPLSEYGRVGGTAGFRTGKEELLPT